MWSWINPYCQFAGMVEDHLDGIIAWLVVTAMGSNSYHCCGIAVAAFRQIALGESRV